jgi:LysR family hydrogen peroxide-inducible transcriptional activator
LQNKSIDAAVIRITFRDLEYLVAVARLSHFGRAAEECQVSQSALSLQVQKLEREVGTQLFERTNRRVVVTEAGKEAVRRAQDLLRGRREFLDAARHFSGGLPATVTIGAIPTIAPYLFADLQAGFRRRFPATAPRFDEEVTGGLVVAVAAQHPLAKKSRVSPHELAAERLLLLKNTHCLREQVVGFCSAHGVSGNQQSAAASIGTLLALVRSKGGITLIPKMAAGAGTKLPGIRCLPLRPSPTRLVRVIFRQTSRVGRRLAEAIRMCLAGNQTRGRVCRSATPEPESTQPTTAAEASG